MQISQRWINCSFWLPAIVWIIWISSRGVERNKWKWQGHAMATEEKSIFCVSYNIGRLFYWLFWEGSQKISISNAMCIVLYFAKSIQLHLRLIGFSRNKFVLELLFKNIMVYHLSKSQVLQIKWPQTNNCIDKTYILVKKYSWV